MSIGKGFDASKCICKQLVLLASERLVIQSGEQAQLSNAYWKDLIAKKVELDFAGRSKSWHK
jgi:hypothetical protein